MMALTTGVNLFQLKKKSILSSVIWISIYLWLFRHLWLRRGCDIEKDAPPSKLTELYNSICLVWVRKSPGGYFIQNVRRIVWNLWPRKCEDNAQLTKPWPFVGLLFKYIDLSICDLTITPLTWVQTNMFHIWKRFPSLSKM